jgi:hypothetical protein
MTSKNRTIGKLLTTSNVDLYTVPARFDSNIKAIYVNNSSSSSVTFSLDWYELKSTTYITLAESVKMPPNSLLQITDNLYLNLGDKLRGLASASNAVTITFNVEEFFQASQNIA